MRAYFYKVLTPAALALLIAGCGGGSSSSDSSGGGSTEAKGEVDVAVTAEPSPNEEHAWVTIKSVWFHKGTVDNPEDVGWLKYPLDSPITIDLNSLANGNLADAFTNLQLPVDTYQQIRVFMVDSDAALTASAQSAGLQYNDQLDYMDDSGTMQHMPIEIVSPNDGVVVHGTFKVQEDEPLELALNFNVDRDVKEFTYEDQTHYLLSPWLTYFDLAHVGAIVGQLDTADLTAAKNVDGAYQVVITAQRPEDDGFRAIERSTTIKADGSFSLFPMFIKDGTDTTDYDIVIRGRGIDTTIIRNVTAQAGTGPKSGQNPTSLQATPISLAASAEYAANLTTPANPTSELMSFYQTVPGVDAPYLMRLTPVDPLTGKFVANVPLSAGPLMVGQYNGGQTISFNSTVPTEGLGAYQVMAQAPLYVSTPAAAPVEPVGLGAVANVSVGTLPVAKPASATKIGGTLTLATPGKYDMGYLTVSRYGYIVTSISLNSILAQNGGSGGNFSVGNIPGNTNSDDFSAGIYRLSAWVWNSADPENTFTRISIGNFVDVRDGSVTNLSLKVES